MSLVVVSSISDYIQNPDKIKSKANDSKEDNARDNPADNTLVKSYE